LAESRRAAQKKRIFASPAPPKRAPMPRAKKPTVRFLVSFSPPFGREPSRRSKKKDLREPRAPQKGPDAPREKADRTFPRLNRPLLAERRRAAQKK
jgi:hypothetical protein